MGYVSDYILLKLLLSGIIFLLITKGGKFCQISGECGALIKMGGVLKNIAIVLKLKFFEVTPLIVNNWQYTV